MGKLLRWFLFLVVLLAAVVYFGVPMLLKTSWAREQVRSALADNTGRDVELGSISFSWIDGLSVSDVKVKQLPGQFDGEGDLFNLGALNIKISIWDVLDKKINVEKLSIDDPEIVIVRDRQGRLNIDDLLGKPSEEKPAEGDAPPVTLNLELDGGRIVFIDQKLDTRIEAKDIEAEATWKNGKLELDMNFDLNGGASVVRGRADLSTKPSPFELTEFTIDGAEFSADMAQLGVFIPLMGDAPKDASGTLGFELRDVKGTGLDKASMERTLNGRGKVSVAAGALVSLPVSNLVAVVKQSRDIFDAVQKKDVAAIMGSDLTKLVTGEGEERLSVSFLTSTFTIENGRVITKDMKLEGEELGVNLNISGWSALNGALDYRIVEQGLVERHQALVSSYPQAAKVLAEKPYFTYKKPVGGEASWGIPWFSKQSLAGSLKGLLEEHLGDKIPEIPGIPKGLEGLLPGGK